MSKKARMQKKNRRAELRAYKDQFALTEHENHKLRMSVEYFAAREQNLYRECRELEQRLRRSATLSVEVDGNFVGDGFKTLVVNVPEMRLNLRFNDFRDVNPGAITEEFAKRIQEALYGELMRVKAMGGYHADARR